MSTTWPQHGRDLAETSGSIGWCKAYTGLDLLAAVWLVSAISWKPATVRVVSRNRPPCFAREAAMSYATGAEGKTSLLGGRSINGRNTDDWYCKFCEDAWGGHFVNRGFRNACFRCQLAKCNCFHGKPKSSTNLSKRVDSASNRPDRSTRGTG